MVAAVLVPEKVLRMAVLYIAWPLAVSAHWPVAAPHTTWVATLTVAACCAAACPADCIRVVPAENTPDNRVSAGERHARIYEINMARCIFCGYCELACPFDAITLGNDFELSEISREALVYTKSMLLEKPALRTPSEAIDPYDVPAQDGEPVLGMYDVVTATDPEGPQA
mgnify:CR=1 FL=1